MVILVQSLQVLVMEPVSDLMHACLSSLVLYAIVTSASSVMIMQQRSRKLTVQVSSYHESVERPINK